MSRGLASTKIIPMYLYNVEIIRLPTLQVNELNEVDEGFPLHVAAAQGDISALKRMIGIRTVFDIFQHCIQF